MEQLGASRFRIAPACLHSSGLEVREVAARGNLAVLRLARQPHFDIVRLARPEARVAGAQRDHPVGKPEFLQHRLGVPGQRFQRGGRVCRLHEVDELDLFELMLPDHAARVLPVTACLRAKAWRVRDEPAGKRFCIQDRLARDVGQGHLSRGNEVEGIFVRRLEQVGFEFG